MRPVASTGTSRYTKRGMRLGGHFIPRGSLVLVPFDAMHHHPDVWEDPDAFIPVRAARLSCTCLPLPPSCVSTGVGVSGHSALLPVPAPQLACQGGSHAAVHAAGWHVVGQSMQEGSW